jgi:hypothetical protein
MVVVYPANQRPAGGNPTVAEAELHGQDPLHMRGTLHATLTPDSHPPPFTHLKTGKSLQMFLV